MLPHGRYPRRIPALLVARAAPGVRRTAEGCTVAKTASAHGDSIASPQCWVTRKSFPSSSSAAVAPRQTMARGFTSATSCSSHGRHVRDFRWRSAFCGGGASSSRPLPLEVLHRVRDVDVRAVDSRRFERAHRGAGRRSHEGLARTVLLIARLFADEHEHPRASALHRTRSACPPPRGRHP